jgi:hypothetical protein
VSFECRRQNVTRNYNWLICFLVRSKSKQEHSGSNQWYGTSLLRREDHGEVLSGVRGTTAYRTAYENVLESCTKWQIPHAACNCSLSCIVGKSEMLLRTGDADFRLYITTVQDGWCKSAFLTRWNSVHLQVLLSATPQGGMFPEASRPQALLGSLVSISWKFQFTKLVSEFVIN